MTHHCEYKKAHSSTLLIVALSLELVQSQYCVLHVNNADSTLFMQNNFGRAPMQALSNGSPKPTSRLVFLINLGSIGILDV